MSVVELLCWFLMVLGVFHLIGWMGIGIYLFMWWRDGWEWEHRKMEDDEL